MQQKLSQIANVEWLLYVRYVGEEQIERKTMKSDEWKKYIECWKNNTSERGSKIYTGQISNECNINTWTEDPVYEEFPVRDRSS